MNEPQSSRFDSWKRGLEETGAIIDNDGRLPEGTKVWTPFGDMDYHGDIPAGYCDPAWGWYRGTILGQSDTNWWFVFLGYDNLPFICQRHITELRRVVTSEGRN
jgi:hypothetical protein